MVRETRRRSLIKLPKPLIHSVDSLLQEHPWVADTRKDFVVDAVRRKVEDYLGRESHAAPEEA